MSDSPLAAEWALLQNQYDSYEKFSLLIKLLALSLVAAALLVSSVPGASGAPPMLIIIVLLWMQDAIWKTFQARIETRLLQLELLLAAPTETDAASAYQYNTQFLLQRPGAVGLILEYLKAAWRPTVAYPYAALVVLLAVVTML